MAPAEEPPQPLHESVDLKDPWLAAFLAWLVPGLGHLYQGRTAKAGLFFVCIMGTFLYGLYLSSDRRSDDGRDLGWGRAVYFSWREGDKRLAYLCQVGVGLPALPALVQASRMRSGKKVLWGGFMAPPRIYDPPAAGDPNGGQPTANELNKYLHHYLELGKHFTMIAGLLNVLAIYDAWGGPVVMVATRKEEEEDEEEEDEDHCDQRDETPADVPS
jgi:TM2 domain-containing membrane protein YozV